MVLIKSKKYFWNHTIAYFPNNEEIMDLIKNIKSGSIIQIQQTNSIIENPLVIRKEMFKTTVIDLTKSLDEIQNGMDPKSCRYEIRKASKMATEIRIERNTIDSVNDFINLYNKFVLLKGHTNPISNKRFKEILEVSDVWVLYYENKIVCGHLLISDRKLKRVRLLLSASTRLENSSEAKISGMLNRYLHWWEINKYKQEEINIYDFGGILEQNDSITKFKLSFGGENIQEYNLVIGDSIAKFRQKAKKMIKRLVHTE